MSIKITDAQIRAWEREKSMLKGQLEVVEQKLAFVYQFSGEQEGSAESDGPLNRPPSQKGDTIIAILREVGGYMAPIEIKDIMRERNTPGKWGKKHLYVHQIIRQEVRMGRIEKHESENKYRAV